MISVAIINLLISQSNNYYYCYPENGASVFILIAIFSCTCNVHMTFFCFAP